MRKNVMKKWTAKKLIAAVLCLICVMSVFMGASTANAASPKAGMKKIGTDFSNFVTYRLFYEMKKDATENYRFSKAADRQNVLKYCQACADGTAWSKVSKRLFGKTTSEKKVLVGEWGLDHPYFTIDRVQKLSGGKYKITVIQMNQDRETKVRTRLGVSTYTIKKTKKSVYGYAVTKLSIKSEYDK